MIKYTLYVLILASGLAQAGINPVPLANDHRVRIIPFDRNNVTQLKCHYDVETTIEYAPGEEIIRATAGQAPAWDVMPSQVRKNILTIKPKLKNADTNLTVLTTHRVYLYELRAREQWNLRGKDITFFLRYEYPNEVNQAIELQTAKRMRQEKQDTAYQQQLKNRNKINPSDISLNYTFSGDKTIAPVSVFDDGLFTYFQFDKHAEIPAIYTVDSERNESMLNHRTQGKYIVVEQLADRFTLRSGNDATTVTRGQRVVERSQTDSSQPDQPKLEW